MPPGIDMLLNSGIGRESRITMSVLASTSFCRSAASMRGVSLSCSTTSPNAFLAAVHQHDSRGRIGQQREDARLEPGKGQGRGEQRMPLGRELALLADIE